MTGHGEVDEERASMEVPYFFLFRFGGRQVGYGWPWQRVVIAVVIFTLLVTHDVRS